jgi:hypothetical protein
MASEPVWCCCTLQLYVQLYRAGGALAGPGSLEKVMSLASLAAIALVSTAAAADTSVEKPQPPAQIRTVAANEQAGTGSTPGAADAAAPECGPGQSAREPNTASVEARPSTPGAEGIWSATP